MHFGSGVRAQVFEVIVRQALAGAPWREICAGPMRVNNISEEEVQAEVDRRLRGFEGVLDEEQQAGLHAYIESWQETLRIDQRDQKSMPAGAEESVAAFYGLLGLSKPVTLYCQSPMRFFVYLSILSELEMQNLTPADFSSDLLDLSNFSATSNLVESISRGDQDEEYRQQLFTEMDRVVNASLCLPGKHLADRFESFWSSDLLVRLDKTLNQKADPILKSYLNFGFNNTMQAHINRAGTAIELCVNSIPAIAERFGVSPDSVLPGLLPRVLPGNPMEAILRDRLNLTLREFPGAQVFRQYISGIWKHPEILPRGFLHEVCVSPDGPFFEEKDGEDLSTILSLYQAAPWYCFYENICFVGSYPEESVFDQTLSFHSLEGPAIRFADGYKIYAVTGIVASRRHVEDPGSLTAAEIESVTNASLRRLLMETYGISRFLLDIGAELINEDECGKLYRKELEGDEPLVMVRVKNSTPEPDGSFKEYFLRVPPTMTTAREAVAWTFDMNDREYSPDSET